MQVLSLKHRTTAPPHHRTVAKNEKAGNITYIYFYIYIIYILYKYNITSLPLPPLQNSKIQMVRRCGGAPLSVCLNIVDSIWALLF